MSPIPPSTANEVAWSKWLAEYMGGVAEYMLPCKSRVDILTPCLAIEVDWVKKWPEAVGQCVYYGVETERQPAILLLLKGLKSDRKYLNRCKEVAAKLNIAVFTWDTTLGDKQNEKK